MRVEPYPFVPFHNLCYIALVWNLPPPLYKVQHLVQTPPISAEPYNHNSRRMKYLSENSARCKLMDFVASQV